MLNASHEITSRRYGIYWKRLLIVAMMTVTLVACNPTRPPQISTGHLQQKIVSNKRVPLPVLQSPVVPLPEPRAKEETYTIVVSNVPVRELLFSLARDAKINVDIHPGIEGKVSINAISQTLPQILSRISTQVNIRYQIKGKVISITPDKPYWQNYRIDYVNMARKSESEVSVATQIATAGGSVAATSKQSTNGNTSKTKVTNTSSNDFWKTIEKNLKILANVDGDKEQTKIVIVNPTSGIVSVKTTQKQHLKIQSFVDRVMESAQRQVLIEVTIVEVELGNRFQAGIDWQRLSNNSGTGSNGISTISNLIGSNLAAAPVFSLAYNRTRSNGSNISATMKLLESFGKVKVISSPKIMALNNQTALLKVVDEKVYFTVELQVETATLNTPERRTFTSQIHTVPVGLVMTVVPQINKEGYVSLNIRPTITRITGFANDPAPALMNANFTNLIPEIQIREMESLLQVANGQTIMMGGLMQNKIDKKTKSLPGLSKYKRINKLLSYRDHDFTKTELVIFIRPTIIKNGSPSSDAYRRYLPKPQGHKRHKRAHVSSKRN